MESKIVDYKEQNTNPMSHEELSEFGYIHPITFQSGRQAAIMPFMFTVAIVADFSKIGYENRWCFSTLNEALMALAKWDGEGDPEGWHRHLPSGRRRDHEGNDLGKW